ncbi:TPA: hypothetical protein ACK3JW_001696 [Mannheimia haemolytica]
MLAVYENNSFTKINEGDKIKAEDIDKLYLLADTVGVEPSEHLHGHSFEIMENMQNRKFDIPEIGLSPNMLSKEYLENPDKFAFFDSFKYQYVDTGSEDMNISLEQQVHFASAIYLNLNAPFTLL